MPKLIFVFLVTTLFAYKLFSQTLINESEYNDVEEIYLEGLEYFENQQFEDAGDFFKFFLDKDPDNELAPRVLFYYAMTHYLQDEFMAAAIAFEELINNYKDSETISSPEFSYYLAKTIYKIEEDNPNVCITVNYLFDSYPNNPLTIKLLEDDNALGCNKNESIKQETKKKEEPDIYTYQDGKIVPIAVTDFYSVDGLSSGYGRDIRDLISFNLERSGTFTSINKNIFKQSTNSLNDGPEFEDWKSIDSPFLVAGRVTESADRLSIEFRLYKVDEQRQIMGKKYETSKRNWRRVGHIISDAIFEAITSTKGIFDSRIVYVATTGPKENQDTRLAIMDQDQENHRFLTDGSYLIATPSFSPNSQKITYASYIKNNSPRVYLFDIETGRQEIVGEFPGMTFGPVFSPDGNKILMSYADPEVGNSEIYILDLRTRITKRLTNNSSIDVSPSLSPDQRQIVFNSDRSGRRHLYVMNSDGSGVKRISKNNGSYYDPVWSPRGDLIAFTKQEGGQFYIGVMNIDGSNERMVAKSFHVEGPKWSPNGKNLIYYKTERTSADGSGGKSSLYMIDLSGYNEREVSTPLGGVQPDWSPLMR